MKSHAAEREAGITKLPAPILHHILSFLPKKEALKTCLLSKSWRLVVSTRPNLSLVERNFKGDKDKFRNVLDKSLKVYSDQNLSIDDFSVNVSMVDPELVLLLQKWIPILIQDIGVKKLYLYFFGEKPTNLESQSLQIKNLHINSVGNNKHLKILHLEAVDIEEESFGKIMSSCPEIESLYLKDCKGLRTINVQNHHNLHRFELSNKDYGRSIEIYLPSSVRDIRIKRCPNWFHHRKYFPGLTCLWMTNVPLSNEWFNSLSRKFPCLEKLMLFQCNGFDEFQLSSRSIKYLYISMHESTTKATIDAPSIKMFHYHANNSQSISFTATTSDEWNSQIDLSLDQLDASQWFLKLSELIAAFSQSHINSLVLFRLYGLGNNQHNIEHLSDISVCCSGSYKMPVAMKSLELDLNGIYYDSFFSDLMNGLFRIIRPSEIKQNWFVYAQKDPQGKRNEAVEFLCRTLQLGKSEDEGMSFWQRDLEEVILEVKNGLFGEWHSVQGTINWSEYVAALLPLKCMSCYDLRFRLKWRELPNSFY